VLDIRDGQAVHAVAGRRDFYRPLQSTLHAGSDPVEIARSVQDALGLPSLYVADLDAIAGGPPRVAIYRRLIDFVPQVWIDAGIRNASTVEPLLGLDRLRTTLVVGLETIAGPSALGVVLAGVGPERVVFSVDLDGAELRAADLGVWAAGDAFELSCRVIEQGVTRVLLLDLSRVGTGRGIGTNALLGRIRAAHPAVDLFVGGGISGIDEVFELRAAGARGVLIGSALHDGRIGRRELGRLAE
jgi:phosphoribosylformimino-5-aminoimidazole carboxamide ribotide isomerase